MPHFGQCTYDREGVGRCPHEATYCFVRTDWNGSGEKEEARVCDRHKMGDGKQGRRDYGWVLISSKDDPILGETDWSIQ